MQIFGGMGQSKVAGQQAAVSEDIATQQEGINQQKQMQMTLEANRSQLENVRNAQRARATATASATSQGAQFGSGLQGGIAGVTDQEKTNSLNINQNFGIGSAINSLNDNISQDNIKMAQLGGQSATDAGIASLGGALVKSSPMLGALGQNAFAGAKNIGSNISFLQGGATGFPHG